MQCAATFVAVFYGAKLAFKDWRKQRRQELADAAAERALSHLAHVDQWLTEHLKHGEPQTLRRAQVEAEAVTDEGHTRANYSKELRERVEDTPYIIPDLASQLEIVDKSMNNRNQQSERRHVMRVLDLASRLGVLDKSINGQNQEPERRFVRQSLVGEARGNVKKVAKSIRNCRRSCNSPVLRG